MNKKILSLLLLSLCLVSFFEAASLDSFEKSINAHLSMENDFDFDKDGAVEEENDIDEKSKASSLKNFIYFKKSSSSLMCFLIFLKKISFPLVNALELKVVKSLYHPPEYR